ncbi:ISAon1 family transposase N-terminal region protein, partial [Bacteroides acidifaciens]
MTSYDTLLVLARLILPVELLDCFDIVEIENDAEMLTIHLDEQNLPPLSPTVHSLESKGFLPAVYIRDFPIRDRKVTLCVRRRKWLNKETGSIICNTF